MKHKLIIFDLDGTLLNTIGDLAAACEAMLQQRALPQHTLAEYTSFVGNGIRNLVKRSLPEEFRTDEYIDSAKADFVEYYTHNIHVHTQPYEGIPALLASLSAAGVKIAVASNKFHEGTLQLIRYFFPDINFVAIYGNREGFPLKPDAQLIEEIISLGDVAREDCVMVGDSAVDIQTAHNSHITSIGVSWGFRSREELIEAGADHIADSVEELQTLLLR
ncbi:MAG: HAD family hydrolase [Rikenellaceae bacterium]|nr:HAD family hydrolase [Rikenellaceae bacterium]